MRAITRDIVQAFRAGEVMSKGNSNTDGNALFLHGNKIAWWDEGHRLWIDTCGWNSNTTRERLNGLPGVKVSTKQGQMFLNGKEWDGQAVKVVEHNPF